MLLYFRESLNQYGLDISEQGEIFATAELRKQKIVKEQQNGLSEGSGNIGM
jgi:hypothetical protein